MKKGSLQHLNGWKIICQIFANRVANFVNITNFLDIIEKKANIAQFNFKIILKFGNHQLGNFIQSLKLLMKANVSQYLDTKFYKTNGKVTQHGECYHFEKILSILEISKNINLTDITQIFKVISQTSPTTFPYHPIQFIS